MQSKQGEVAGERQGEAAGYANEVGLRQKGVSGVARRQRRERKVNYTNESVELWSRSLPRLPPFYLQRETGRDGAALN